MTEKEVKKPIWISIAEATFVVILAFCLLHLVSWLASVTFDENFDSCWLVEEEYGIDKKTGREANREFHIDCSRFEAN